MKRSTPSLLGRLCQAWLPGLALPHRTRMQVEAMEERILHSADLGAGVLGMAAAAPQMEQRLLDDAGEFESQATAVQQATAVEIVFIDSATPDSRSIVDDIAARSDGRALEVVMLDAAGDGIARIGDYLDGRDDVTAVHLISHGSDGRVQLGSASLDAASRSTRGTDIARWSAALSAGADILIYGCDVAATDQGKALVSALANLTGADVAASDDLTGAAARGGDWNLEYAAGRIDAAVAVSSALQSQWTGVLANASPVLGGAEDMTPILEDAATNAGTLVSALVAGHVTDADAGALSGIAVIAVDNTNGTWQYSTNGGGSWTSFGTPSATNARLLAADANTFVRFVPNADWNGTVANGLTFRAWDQTSGTAGGTADSTTTTSTLLDQFNAASYSNNDGTQAWSTSWIDNDGDPSAGAVQVSGGRMQLQTLLGGGVIWRQADLTGATSATLTFDFDNQILLSLGGNIALQVSGNGGGSYSTLATFSSSSNTGSTTFSANITGFIAGNTRIQFVSSGLTLVQSLFIDNVQISYVTPLASGVTAFSNATASSSMTVTPVNDAPAGADRTITAVEDTPHVLTVADFGFADSHDTPANNFTAVTVTTLPVGGSLTLNGVAVIAGQSIAMADILGGDLVFTPAANAAGTGIDSFTFQVQDDGGGTDLDPSANTLTFDVTAVNDPPAGTDNTITLAENGAHAFTAAEFGFTDPDVPPDNFVAVTIASLPGAGSLTLAGTAVTAGQSIALGLLNAGQLRFTPAADADGIGYASFTFQVEASGGAANIDPTPRTMTIDVTGVNTAPAAVVPGAQVTMSATPLVFSSATGNAILISDIDAGAAAVQVALGTSNGTLALSGTAGLAFTVGTGSNDATMTFTGSLAAVNAALDGLQFVPAAGFAGSTGVSIAVDDLGNFGTGGPLTASAAVSIDVDAVPIVASPAGPSAGPPVPPVSPAGLPPPTTPRDGSIAQPPAPSLPGGAAEEPEDEIVSGSGRIIEETSEPVLYEPESRPAAVAHGDESGSGGRGGNVAFGARDMRWLLATSEQPEIVLADYALGSGSVGIQAAQAALQSQALADSLDRLREGMQEEARVEFNTVAFTAAASLSLSVGYVLWLLRGGILVSSMLSSMPAWRFVDPLPILGRLEEEDDLEEPDETLESMVEHNNRTRDAEPAPA